MMRPALARPLVFGLLNNMPDAAMQQTETQFLDMLQAAAPCVSVRLELFSLPGVSRSELARLRIAGPYRSAAALTEAGLDGLIVTGMEPKAGGLRGESWWPHLATIIDWAGRTATPTLFSCLAAHAAVLHRDGIERVRQAGKISGLYRCHGTDLRSAWLTPHSRWHDLRETELVARGYAIVSRLAEGGVDAFAARDAPFLFLQGHPEYDRRALLREYARDVMRAINGERAAPAPPRGYVDGATEAAMLRVGGDIGVAPAAVLRAELSRIVQDAMPRHHRQDGGGLSLVADWIDAHVMPNCHAGQERIAS